MISMLVPLASIGVNRVDSTEWSLCARTASAATMAVSPGLKVTGGGAVLAVDVGVGRGVGSTVDVGLGVAGGDGVGVGADLAGEGLATATVMEAPGVDGVGARSASCPAEVPGGVIVDPADEHAAKASTRMSPISRTRPFTLWTSSPRRRM
jgi:hypothetical protein